MVGCWRGYLFGSRYRFAYGPADATATHCQISAGRETEEAAVAEAAVAVIVVVAEKKLLCLRLQ